MNTGRRLMMISIILWSMMRSATSSYVISMDKNQLLLKRVKQFVPTTEWPHAHESLLAQLHDDTKVKILRTTTTNTTREIPPSSARVLLDPGKSSSEHHHPVAIDYELPFPYPATCSIPFSLSFPPTLLWTIIEEEEGSKKKKNSSIALMINNHYFGHQTQVVRSWANPLSFLQEHDSNHSTIGFHLPHGGATHLAFHFQGHVYDPVFLNVTSASQKNVPRSSVQCPTLDTHARLRYATPSAIEALDSQLYAFELWRNHRQSNPCETTRLSAHDVMWTSQMGFGKPEERPDRFWHTRQMRSRKSSSFSFSLSRADRTWMQHGLGSTSSFLSQADPSHTMYCTKCHHRYIQFRDRRTNIHDNHEEDIVGETCQMIQCVRVLGKQFFIATITSKLDIEPRLVVGQARVLHVRSPGHYVIQELIQVKTCFRFPELLPKGELVEDYVRVRYCIKVRPDDDANHRCEACHWQALETNDVEELHGHELLYVQVWSSCGRVDMAEFAIKVFDLTSVDKRG